MTASIVERVIAEVRPYSVVPNDGLACTITLTLDAIERDIPGDLVECGVWRGGASFAMLLAQRYYFDAILRPVWMYDSFQGMGEPGPQDGGAAIQWKRQSLTEPDPLNENWCVAATEDVYAAARLLGLMDHIQLVPGWFRTTLPLYRPTRIAVLRVDCDWHEPCSIVYRELAPLVSTGGPIIVDDYYVWEGCKTATHEFLDRHGHGWPIMPAPGNHGVYMIVA